MSKLIERALEEERWFEARVLIRDALQQEPDNHWLITRLGLTYYEQRQYKRALQYTRKALALAPQCPLVLWDYAGCLEMLDQPQEALDIYRRLIRRGVDRLADGDCGEGIVWARGLVADCHYRVARCYQACDNKKQARTAYRRHLALRESGCRSIYPKSEVKKELQQLNAVCR
ncbi:MAG: tetratricopeptide repeat protein [Kiritimatiellaceae bacterium]|nr:tetratricopeptide repeat protein [Kiritimatiellaceae bacterium]